MCLYTVTDRDSINEFCIPTFMVGYKVYTFHT